MKRIMCLLLILTMVVASSALGFGQVITENGEVSPCYVATTKVKQGIDPGLGMQLKLYAGLEPKSSSGVDEVKITMKVMNYVTGGVVHNKTYNAEYNYLTDYYEAKDTCTVPTPGSYYMHVTYKAYKNSVLLETITQNSVVISVE